MTRRSVLLLGLALLLAACSDSDDTGQGPAPDAANDSQSDTLDTLPDPDVDEDPTSDPDVEEDVVQDVEGDVGVADLGDDSANDVADADDMADSADDMADVDAADADADAADADAMETDMADAPMCNSGCPSGAPTGGNNAADAARPQEVIIVAVDFETDRVVLQNISGEATTKSGWQLCQGPGNYTALPDLVFAADGDTIALDLLGSGTDTATELFLGLPAAGTWNLGENDNLALYVTSSFVAANIESYVLWERSAAAEAGREAHAVTASLWQANSPIEVCAGSTGIIAAGGDVTNPANWTNADDPESCP